MPEVKLMTPLFDGGMYNRTGRRMRAVFIKEVSDGATTYRLWRKDGKPEIEYPRCDNDRYILHVEVNSYLIPLRMTEFQMIDNCGYTRLRELAEADKDGRLVVRPCKVGDTLFRVFAGEILEHKVRNMRYLAIQERWDIDTTPFCPYVESSIGKTIFLTHEEAERALMER